MHHERAGRTRRRVSIRPEADRPRSGWLGSRSGGDTVSDLETWAVVMAGGLALPAITIGVGLVWMRRHLARVAAEDRAAVRAAFTMADLPARDEIVQLLIDADDATPSFTFAHHEPDLGWMDPDTSRPILGSVSGWRRHPYYPGRRREADEERPMDDLARELASLFPDAHRHQTKDARVARPQRHAEWESFDADGRVADR